MQEKNMKKVSKEGASIRRFKSDIPNKRNFQRIIKFYLFDCPIENVSKRGQSFKDLGWYGASRFRMLERHLKACSGINEEKWAILETSREVVEHSKEISFNEPFLFSNQPKGRVKSFIYSIRCAFAHGAFEIIKIRGKAYYYFENDYRGNANARIFLSEDTLIEWIRIIKTNPKYLTKKYEI